jgi:hypothetical protein
MRYGDASPSQCKISIKSPKTTALKLRRKGIQLLGTCFLLSYFAICELAHPIIIFLL